MATKQSRQIWIIFLIPSLLSALLLAWFLQHELHDWAIESWSADHSAFANSLGEQIDAEITEASNLLRYTTTLPEFSSSPNTELIDRSVNGIPMGIDTDKRNILDNLRDTANFSVLFVLTPEGDHYLSHPYTVQEKLKKYNLSDRPYFIEAKKTKKLVISDRFIGADGIPAIALNVPILSADGKIVAHLGGVMHLKRMAMLIEKQQIAPFDHAVILDRQGNSVTNNHTDNKLHLSLSDISDTTNNVLSIHSIVDDEGVSWLKFQRKLKTGWELALLRRMSSLQDEIAPHIHYTLWFGVSIILLTSLIGAILAYRFSRRWQVADEALKHANLTLEKRVKERTAELERSETRHRTLFESTADAIVLISGTQLIDCNSAALTAFGVKDKATLLHLHIADISAAHQSDGSSSLEAAESKMAEALEKGILRFEWLHKRLDTGDIFPTEVVLSKLIINKQALLQGTVRDISERKRTETRIRILSQAIEQSPVSVVITDTKGDIEYVNHAFETVTGYSETEVLGKNSRLLKSGNTPEKRYHELWSALKKGTSWLGEFQNKRKNGEIFWEQAHIAPVFDADGTPQHFLAVKQDVTPQKHQEACILHQAHFDSLTELPNRFLSLNRLEEYIKEAKRNQSYVGVIFLDLDDFKKINDSLGHETGDNLLKTASVRLKSSLRDGDTVGRLGGDEFIILLGDIKQTCDIQPVIEKLLNCFREPIHLNNRDLIITASIGVAIYPDNGETPTELLRNSDTAMYQSKAEGRNTYQFFTPEMNQQVRRRLELEEQLHTALEKEELSVHYHPIVDINKNSIIGAEALLRWNNSTLGNVSPEEFIPIAEHTGLIVPIGEFVLTEALSNLSVWIKQYNHDFRVAVNISPRQFRDPMLIPFIEQKMLSNNVKGDNLELEITEGVLMAGHSYIDNAIQKLCDLKISIAMDDFGTGYSSLSYLRSYPFSTLKIDRSFVHDIHIDPADRELVNATIAMAHGLGLKVVAEGVETKEQLEHLAQHRCNFAQGYLFSKPIPKEAFSQLLRSEYL